MEQIEQIQLADDGVFPNSHLPVLICRDALDIPVIFPAMHVQNLFKKNGWSGGWNAGIFTFHHYHSTAHEVLGIYSGKTTLQLGGESGPEITVKRGDVLVIPAGVAHKNLGEENAVGVVGAYAGGKKYDMNYGIPGERPQTDENIRQVPLPATDPLQGEGGDLTAIWANAPLP